MKFHPGALHNFVSYHILYVHTSKDFLFFGIEGTPIQKGTFQLAPNMPIMHTDEIWWSNIGDLETEKKVFHYIKGFLQI